MKDLGFERGHRTLHIVGKGDPPAPCRSCRAPPRHAGPGSGERTTGPILRRTNGLPADARAAYRSLRGCTRTELSHVHPHMLRAGFIMATLDTSVPLHDIRLVARHADPRTATVYDHRRHNYDRHTAYAIVALVTRR